LGNDIISTVNSELRSLKDRGYNIPGTTVITTKPPFFKPVIRIVEIDTAMDSRGKIIGSDIYPVTGGKYAFTFTAIKRFIDAGRIEFGKPEIDINSEFETVTAYVRGSRFDIEGTVRVQSDGKTINIPAREFEITETYSKKGEELARNEKWTEERLRRYIDMNVKSYMIQLRKFAVERAISGAQARVVAKLLGMKQSYPLGDLKKPFVVLSVIPDIDMEDQRIKEVVTLNAIGLRDIYYPAGGSLPQVPQAHVSEQKGIRACETRVMNGNRETRLPQVEDFLEFPVERQKEILRKLAVTRGISSSLPVENMTEEERKSLYERIHEAA
jgi:hypothetical protein